MEFYEVSESFQGYFICISGGQSKIGNIQRHFRHVSSDFSKLWGFQGSFRVFQEDFRGPQWIFRGILIVLQEVTGDFQGSSGSGDCKRSYGVIWPFKIISGVFHEGLRRVSGSFKVYSRITWNLQERLKKFRKLSEELRRFYWILKVTSCSFWGFRGFL